ncbi:glycosyltransferase [Ensifer adhaerens]|nr:glycosyltransferase [Ensifer adhaerens]UAY05135.1 glycosyltransferase [Ensifer adhaerens]UAY12554.1 glycosyltransferase [Ensifer adhaerens]
MRITARDVEVRPRLYVNKGRGFIEDDSVSIGIGSDFLIIADVGTFGTICSLRMDPCDEECKLFFRAETFRNTDELERYVSLQRQNAEGLSVAWLPTLPRFWKRFPIALFQRRRSAVAEYMSKASNLADSLVAVQQGVVRPWLSIVVPVYNAPARHLRELVESFERQNMAGTELIFSDDGSDSVETLDWLSSRKHDPNVVIVLNAVNQGIAAATNAGLKAARGDWVTLLDHDDLIAPNGLRVIQHAMSVCPEAAFLYTDELIVDDRLQPISIMLKPAYDPVLLTGVNYINHFSVYQRERLEEIGLLRVGFEGSQDYDLLLRYLDGLEEKNIVHVPYPAYWWRRTALTYSLRFLDRATDSARRALVEEFSRKGKPADVVGALTSTLHRVEFKSSSNCRPKISIIIPNLDSTALMTALLTGIFETTEYNNFEVVVIDNGSKDPTTIALYKRYAEKFANFSYYIRESSFNFSRAVNEGIARGRGEHFLLLNNDVTIVEGKWLDEMVDCLTFEKVGIVGAKLLYPNQRIQHAGVVCGLAGLAGHWYANKPSDYGGPMNRLHVRSSMTCVTGAAMLISGACVRVVGRWDEENFAVAYNDVDYCLRAHKSGFRIVWTPFACLIHHESASRGSDAHGESRRRFEREQKNLRRIHQTQIFEDPASSPGYTKDRSDPKIEILEALPAPRRWFE